MRECLFAGVVSKLAGRHATLSVDRIATKQTSLFAGKSEDAVLAKTGVFGASVPRTFVAGLDLIG